MTRRIEAGPVLVIVGAIVLIVSLFLDWFDPGVTAWTVFELIDLLLAALALAAIVAAAGLMLPDSAVLDRRWLWPATLAVAVLVISQIIDPPPAVGDGDVQDGVWLALGAAVAMLVGVVLIFSRVHLAVTVEGRDLRRRVAAVDARDERPAAPSEEPAASPAASASGPSTDPLATQPLPPPNRPAPEREEPSRSRAPWERLSEPSKPGAPASDDAPRDEPGREGGRS